jgi:hypothetical protein
VVEAFGDAVATAEVVSAPNAVLATLVLQETVDAACRVVVPVIAIVLAGVTVPEDTVTSVEGSEISISMVSVGVAPEPTSTSA